MSEAPGELADAFESCELSDAFLIIDPRCLPIRDFQLSALMRHYAAEPRVAHHLVAFETAIAGTRERVSFDARGQVRGIHRHYEQATWPFIAGIAATVMPSACGVLADGVVPRSLAELRQILTARGVPSRDVPIEGGALDLSEEGGMLAANELAILKATSARTERPCLRGATSRRRRTFDPRDGSVCRAGRDSPGCLHRGTCNGAGSGRHWGRRPDCLRGGRGACHDRPRLRRAQRPDRPRSRVVRERRRATSQSPVDHPALSYGERLARLSVDPHEDVRSNRTRKPPNRRRHLRLKRALDITVAALSLGILTPLFVVVAAVIWLESRGPIFYGDKREGLRGRVFGCWKFRTMYTGAHLAQRDLNALDHTDGPHFKVDRDPRVTRVGRFLRATNLDEIPQLLNVLLGQMSLVGPRPSPFRENQICVPWREARLSVRPGVTGFWQVCRHDRSAGDFHQWIEYDLLYVQHLSFWLDLKILAATLLTLGGKAAHVPASWLVDGLWVNGAGTEAPQALRQGGEPEREVAA